jgi:hypothetical protein
MSKKIMVLARAVVSAAFFALPAMSSATELHLEKNEPFNISGVGGELRAVGEPTITCTETRRHRQIRRRQHDNRHLEP